MKKFYLLFFVILFSKNHSQTISIPDVNFKAILLQANTTNNIAKDLAGNPTKIDQNNDGEILVSEAENISKISLNNRNIDFVYYYFTWQNSYTIKDIYSLEGINSFKNLKQLDCSFAKISTIDFTNLTKLTEIYCSNNLVTSFTNFHEIKSLFVLDCSNNLITNLDLSQSSVNNFPEMQEVLFKFHNNNLQYLNLQNNKTTIWYCLCSPIDASCPFGNLLINTCTHIPSLAGNPNLIEVKVNCGEKSTYEQFSSSSTSFTENCGVAATQESDFAKKFKIYPNPAKDFIGIETKEKIIEISILDYSGKLVYKQQKNFSNISVNRLVKGNYILKIKSNDKEVDYKFIKN